MRSPKLTILFSGMIAADPGQGGATWAVLQYLLGLRRLGHDVWFIEPIKAASIRPAGAALAASDNAAYFRTVMSQFGLESRSALLLDGANATVGAPYVALLETASRADAIVNVSGMLTDPAILERVRTRAYLDLDPAFVQLWSAAEGIDMRFDAHTHFVTVGQAIGEPGCPVPTCGRAWLKTWQPVVLDHWTFNEAGPAGPAAAWTTVANWRGYGSVQHEGVLYGQKAHSLRQMIDLPRRTTERFELALAIHPAESKDLAALAANGWHLIDPAMATATPDQYRRFVRASKGEIGIAKSGYVLSRSGWFSDRSACYLASGRPVVAQDTGFSKRLPTGEGLLAFDDVDGAAAAVDAVAGDYARHRRAARALAEEHFDSDVVLARLLREIEVIA